jgi:hypothetical protein
MSEIIWQSVLDQLRQTMPHTAFNTWVADTRFLSSDGSVFLVGCQDVSACDWLNDRLLSTVERLLAGILNRSVTVSFVVASGQASEVGAGELEIADNEVQVEVVWDSAYEQIVRPEKAIAVNVYFLHQLRQIGPELGWLYIGFRQAAYSVGGRSGNRTARFAGKTVAALSGMSERTFWRRVGSKETWQRLTGLVNLVGEKPLWDEKSATPKRLPRKYSVAMTLPLTATDAKSLMRWIGAHWDNANPASTLELACKTPVEEIIPANAATVSDQSPMPVSQIIRELFSDDIPEANLKALTERLQMHLMPPGDLVMISLFFVEHVLPHLGAGPGWMLTILRDRCWVSPENGETRRRATVKGGYAEIAGWLGLERPLTVYEWLNGRHKSYLLSRESESGKKPNPKAGKFINSPLRVYLREVTGQKATNFREGQREFEILLEEIPPEIMAAIVAQKRPHLYGSDSIAPTELANDLYGIVSIGFTELADDLYGNDSIALTELSDDLYGNGRVFKLLSSLKPALKTLLKTTAAESFETPSSKMQKTVVVDKDWDLSSLFRANSVSAKSQRRMREAKVHATAFVSWILYGYTATGRGLTGLVGNAIRNVLESNSGAGGVCDTLAGYGPGKLTNLVAESLRGALITDQDFVSAFGGLTSVRKQELLARLGGQAVEVPEQKPDLPSVHKTTVTPEEAEQNRAAIEKAKQKLAAQERLR